MNSPNLSRKKAVFRAALALAETTQEVVAPAFGVTPEHLSLVLSGKRESPPLLAKVDRFCLEVFEKNRTLFTSAA